MKHFIPTILRALLSAVVGRSTPAIKLWVPAGHDDGPAICCSLMLDGRYSAITVQQAQTISGRSIAQFEVTRTVRQTNQALGRFASFSAACRFAEGL